MLLNDPADRSLYDRLVDVLGEREAMILVRYLPPSRDDLATKADMERLESRMDPLEDRMDRLEAKMEGLENKMDGFHQALREQTRTLVMAQAGSLLAVAGLAYGAARLI